MMNDESQPGACAGCRPFQHLQVPIGISKGRDRPFADEPLDIDRLAWTVVDGIHRCQTLDDWLAVRIGKPGSEHGPNYLFRWNSVHTFCPGPHELLLSAGHDVGFESIAAKKVEHL